MAKSLTRLNRLERRAGGEEISGIIVCWCGLPYNQHYPECPVVAAGPADVLIQLNWGDDGEGPHRVKNPIPPTVIQHGEEETAL